MSASLCLLLVMQGCEKVCQLCLVYNRVEASLWAQRLLQKAAQSPIVVPSVLDMLKGETGKIATAEDTGVQLVADGRSSSA